ncbi:nuclease-related domain-containing protein [Limosilactobacillus allomucosae]|uniref:nuclease-related domain-containing protein n=1 Tax=Limosilactobacillus allomucosae TaxID=3142938 RepID=UPI0032661E9D
MKNDHEKGFFDSIVTAIMIFVGKSVYFYFFIIGCFLIGMILQAASKYVAIVACIIAVIYFIARHVYPSYKKGEDLLKDKEITKEATSSNSSNTTYRKLIKTEPCVVEGFTQKIYKEIDYSAEKKIVKYDRNIFDANGDFYLSITYVPGTTAGMYKPICIGVIENRWPIHDYFAKKLIATADANVDEQSEKRRKLVNNIFNRVTEIVSELYQTNSIPESVRCWFANENMENYKAIRSIRMAGQAGRNLGSNQHDTMAGIRHLNDLVKEYNQTWEQLWKDDAFFYIDVSYGITRHFLDFLNTDEQKIKTLDDADLRMIQNDITGDDGEMAVQKQLRKFDGGSDSKILTDVIIPYQYGDKKSTTQVDALYLSRHGIFNIEVKTRRHLESVRLSDNGQLVINGRNEDSSNPLLEQISIHHSALRVLFENSGNPVIQDYLRKTKGRLPIVNVLVLIDDADNNDFKIDAESFKSNGILASSLASLYHNVISGSYGDYIDHKTLQQMYRLLQSSASFNIFDSHGNSHRKGRIRGKAYEHIALFPKINGNSQADVRTAINDFERYVVLRMRNLQKLITFIKKIKTHRNTDFAASLHVNNEGLTNMDFLENVNINELGMSNLEVLKKAAEEFKPAAEYLLSEHELNDAFPKAPYSDEFDYFILACALSSDLLL